MKKTLCMLMTVVMLALLSMTACAESEVTVDIVTITPKIGIDTQSAVTYATVYDSVVCKCATANGELVWLHIGVEDFKTHFDSDARVGVSQFSFADTTGMAEPIRVSGKQVKADDVVSGLAGEIGAETMIEFGTAQVLEGVAVEEAPFAADVSVMKPVYVEIASIVPKFRLQAGNMLEATNIVCAAKNAAGDDVYVAMSVDDYKTQIDGTAILGYLFSANEVKYDVPKTFHGVTFSADEVATGLAKEIGTDVVFCFGSME